MHVLYCTYVLEGVIFHFYCVCPSSNPICPPPPPPFLADVSENLRPVTSGVATMPAFLLGVYIGGRQAAAAMTEEGENIIAGVKEGRQGSGVLENVWLFLLLVTLW